MGLWDLKFLNQVCHQVGFMNVCSLLAWPSFTAEPAGCSVVHSEQAVCPVIFPLWQKVVPPLPPPYMHLLASNIFSALFLFDLYNDVGLFSHLADNHESSGL